MSVKGYSQLSISTSVSYQRDFFDIQYYDQNLKRYAGTVPSISHNLRVTYMLPRIGFYAELKNSRANVRIDTKNSTTYQGARIKTEKAGYGVGELHLGTDIPLIKRVNHEFHTYGGAGFVMPLDDVYRTFDNFKNIATQEAIDVEPYVIAYTESRVALRQYFNFSLSGGITEKIRLSDRSFLDIYVGFNKGFFYMYDVDYDYWFPVNATDYKGERIKAESYGSYIETGAGLTFILKKRNPKDNL